MNLCACRTTMHFSRTATHDHGERFNSINHAVGACLAAVGVTVLITAAARGGDPWKITSLSIYAAMLLALYLTSCLYHAVRGMAKVVSRKMDHCADYLLIAGTHTPFTLVTLRGAWRWSLCGIIWSLALLGIAQEIWYARGARTLSLVIYRMMGWLAVIAIQALIAALGRGAPGWRGPVVYCRNRFLRHRSQGATWPRHLARIRPRRQHLPLHRGPVLPRLTGVP